MALRLIIAALLDWLQHRPEARQRRAVVLCFLIAVTTLLALRGTETAAAESITVAVPRARVGEFFTADRGAQPATLPAAMEAQQLNASLPIDDSGLQPARPFVLTGTPDQRQQALLCLTQAVYYEAGFEPLEGRRAVAQVVLNRVRHAAFPNSVCGVVYQKSESGVCQFTFVCDGKLERRPVAGAWREAEDVARAALLGAVEPAVGEATHYHADYVAPPWAPLLQKVAVIGQHIFYRWQGPAGDPAAFTARYAGESPDLLPDSSTPTDSLAASQHQVAVSAPRVGYDFDTLLASAPAKPDTASD